MGTDDVGGDDAGLTLVPKVVGLVKAVTVTLIEATAGDVLDVSTE